MRRLSRFRQIPSTPAVAQRSRGLPLTASLVPLWIHAAGHRCEYRTRACGVNADPALKHDRRADRRQGGMTMTERRKGVVEGNEGEDFGTLPRVNDAGFIYLYINECMLDILMGNS